MTRRGPTARTILLAEMAWSSPRSADRGLVERCGHREASMAETVVVAFGGNAVLRAGQAGTLEDQRRNIRAMARELATLVAEGHRLVVVHGNGPQVGMLQLQQELAAPEIPAQPLFISGAMTQGQLGYLIQEGLQNALAARGLEREVAALVSRAQSTSSNGRRCAPWSTRG